MLQPTPETKAQSQPITKVEQAASPPEEEDPPLPLIAQDDRVAKLPTWRRWVILFSVCWMALPMVFLSTSIMTAMPEIAASLNTTTTSISTANACVVAAMAASALIWLPISVLIGRRRAYIVATVILILCAMGCALARNLASLTAVWAIGATTGPFFLVAGQTILADIFEPTVRGTAVGFFLGSCVSSQSIAPLVGSVIATYTTWRAIFGVLSGISFIGLVLAYFFVPKASELSNLSTHESAGKKLSRRDVLRAFNPSAVFYQWKYPGVILSNLACGLLGLNQYAILSSVRHLINPLFGLTSPLQSGLFYLAPGVGFLLGSIVGGNLSDRVVKRYIDKREGVRLAEDRLNSTPLWVLGVLPLGTFLYGWSIDKSIGGMGLPISAAFIQGFGLMASFSGLNTYAAGEQKTLNPFLIQLINLRYNPLESNPEYKTAVISGKYVVQYCFGAVGVGATVPLIDSIGAGWTFSIGKSVI
ncbi:unnamed protein product [Clonostachys solani]|uniref:Major facilitator superfamily (MFS) profile domain-containing protein n=1 Tax=Clonostachys solani TaxID=160281 RepID=A0A9N9ZQG1_9HYPO|nr:unnamed protein product [Clonostachys solani]